MKSAVLIGCVLLAFTPAAAMAQVASHEDRTPDSPLEGLLRGVVHTQSGARAFEAAFMEQKVYIRITPETFEALRAARGPDGRLTARTPIQLWAVTSETPSPLVPMFTSEAAFRRAYPEHPWVSASGREALSTLTTPMAVRVSDGDGHQVTWTVEELRMLQARHPAPASPSR